MDGKRAVFIHVISLGAIRHDQYLEDVIQLAGIKMVAVLHLFLGLELIIGVC